MREGNSKKRRPEEKRIVEPLAWTDPAQTACEQAVSGRMENMIIVPVSTQLKQSKLDYQNVSVDEIEYVRSLSQLAFKSVNPEATETTPQAHFALPTTKHGLKKMRGLKHNFLGAAVAAFDAHRPFVLSPDHLWLLIVQSLSLHVNANSEELRTGYVSFEGKMQLSVRRDDFVMDSPDNDWAGVVDEFAQQIDEHAVDDLVPLLAPNFSSTGPVERIATKTTIMEVTKSFFNYMVKTQCGFPQIRLKGVPEDWQKLHDHAKMLLESPKVVSEFGARWAASLLPILAQIAETASSPESADVEFWNSMIKIDGVGGSGGYSYLDGWIVKFFPFWGEGCDKQPRENPLCFREHTGFQEKKRNSWEMPRMPDLAYTPSGVSVAPVAWDYLGTNFELAFCAGFAPYSVLDDGAISPNLTWLVTRNGKAQGDSLATKAYGTVFLAELASVRDRTVIKPLSNGLEKVLACDVINSYCAATAAAASKETTSAAKSADSKDCTKMSKNQLEWKKQKLFAESLMRKNWMTSISPNMSTTYKKESKSQKLSDAQPPLPPHMIV